MSSLRARLTLTRIFYIPNHWRPIRKITSSNIHDLDPRKFKRKRRNSIVSGKHRPPTSLKMVKTALESSHRQPMSAVTARGGGKRGRRSEGSTITQIRITGARKGVRWCVGGNGGTAHGGCERRLEFVARL